MTPRRYTTGPTPLEPLDRLSAHIGGPRLWVKRDDLTGLAAGGNKTRKLEYLVADALAQGCDTLITCGAVQSNHCRLTAAAAAREGMQCHLVLREKQPDQFDPDASGNHLLYQLLGATLHIHPPGTDLDATMAALATDLEASGRRAYVIPMGGSNAIGACGYVRCADEIRSQAKTLDIDLGHVVVASSSGGTQSGLVVGMLGSGAAVHGISVDEPMDVLTGVVSRISEETADRLQRPRPTPDAVRVHTDYIGPGYAQPTDEMVQAVRLFAQLEGIVLDPVYTGKGAAGFIDLARRGSLVGTAVFVHTGGLPALFAYPHPTVPDFQG
jgi:D-cysteine desulfhydrase